MNGTRSTREHALHIISSNARRGAEVFAVELADALNAEYPSEVIALQEVAAGSTQDVKTLGRNWRSWGTLRRLRAAMRGASVVVAHGSVTLPASVLAGVGLGVPIIYKNIGDPWFWATSPRRRLRTIALLRRVAHVAALSPGAADAVIKCWRVRPSKVSVTGGGRDPRRYFPASRAERLEARKVLGLDPDRQVIVYLGALSPEKRPDLAVATAAKLPGVTLLMAGDGPERAAVEQQARSYADRIRILGARRDSLRLLHASDLLVLPSASEGLPGVLIEAGLCGLALVAADVGFVREVVQDGSTGVLVRGADPDEWAEAIRLAMSQREELGEAARRLCLAEFDVAQARLRWLNLLRRVGAGRRPLTSA